MNRRWHVLLFLLIFGVESFRVVRHERNSPPPVGDAAEVHNIAWSVAHGRGYSFDWNDEQWRALWQAQNSDGRFDFAIVRRGGPYPTMFRPPLMPVLVAATLTLFPQHSFIAWRLLDSATFALAACLLCDLALIHGGFPGLVAVLLILIGDPLRREFIPGWWTEGLAFTLLSLIVWLIASGPRLRLSRYNRIAGLAVGLLCLDRSVFVLIIPLICLALAFACSISARALINSFLIILAIAILIQLPWWARNVAVSGRLVPLGSAGGYNLPDDYSDFAVESRGEWTGKGIRDVWKPHAEVGPQIPIPPGFSKESFRKIWPAEDPNDLRQAAVLYAAACTSLESELAVSAAGQRAATDWIRSNYTKLPSLMAAKVYTLIYFKRRSLAAAATLCALAFFTMRQHRRMFLCLGLLIASCLLAVAVTHAVSPRFLIPILPPLYVGSALGMSSIVRTVAQRIK